MLNQHITGVPQISSLLCFFFIMLIKMFISTLRRSWPKSSRDLKGSFNAVCIACFLYWSSLFSSSPDFLASQLNLCLIFFLYLIICNINFWHGDLCTYYILTNTTLDLRIFYDNSILYKRIFFVYFWVQHLRTASVLIIISRPPLWEGFLTSWVNCSSNYLFWIYSYTT